MIRMGSHTSGDAPLMVSVSGLRGLVGSSLTPDVVCRYALALARWVRDTRRVQTPVMVLARDGRQGGHAVHTLAAGALMSAGCRVIDLDIATTPTAGFMVLHHHADGGLVVTASHNPAEWNGLKPITHFGAAPAPEEAKRIIELFHTQQGPLSTYDDIGAMERDDSAATLHTQRVIRAVERVMPAASIASKRFKVVLDSVNASGRFGGAELLRTLGCDFVHINADSSGIFPHPPEPLAENLTSLCDAVKQHKTQVGFVQDPDADRLAIVDEHGHFIGEEYTLALAAMSLLGGGSSATPAGASSPKLSLAANLSTSRMIDDIAARHGANIVRTPVGEANVVAGMRRAGSVLGGEGNGGVIWPEIVPIRDSLSAMALVLALMARTGQSISTLVSQIPAYAIEKRKLTLRDASAVERAQRAVAEAFEGGRVDRQDGVRVDFVVSGGAGWVHARASNTEPIFRLIAEAPTREQAQAALDKAQRAING